MACVDELEEQRRAVLADGEVADLVDDEQGGMGQHLQAAGQVAGGLGLGERFDQAGEGAVVDAPSGLGGGDREADREVGLADAGRAEEDHVLGAGHEAELVQLSICSRLMLGWKAKSNSASVFTAGRREARMAVCRRRLLRSTIWACSSCSMASLAVAPPLSACARISSTASRAPGILRSASIARTRSRRLIAAAVTVRPPCTRAAAAAALTRRARPRRRGRRGAEAPVGVLQRAERAALVAFEAVDGTFAGGAVPANVGDIVHPARRLRVEIGDCPICCVSELGGFNLMLRRTDHDDTTT